MVRFWQIFPTFWSSFFCVWVLPLLVTRHCSKLSSYAIWSKANASNLRKWQKTLDPIWPAWQKLEPPKFFWEDLPLLELDIVPSYHLRHFTETVINQTSENDKKTNFGPDFGLFWAAFGLPNFFFVNFGSFEIFSQNLDSKNFFYEFYFHYMLDIIATYHCIQFQGKLKNQTWEKVQQSSSGTNFSPFWPKFEPQKLFSWNLPLLNVKNCCKLSSYAISRKANQPNLNK